MKVITLVGSASRDLMEGDILPRRLGMWNLFDVPPVIPTLAGITGYPWFPVFFISVGFLAFRARGWAGLVGRASLSASG